MKCRLWRRDPERPWPSDQVSGIPLSADYRVHVNGVSAPVYIMPTRYDVPYQNGHHG
jgi:hypothetical protein